MPYRISLTYVVITLWLCVTGHAFDIPQVELPENPAPLRDGPPVGFVVHPHEANYDQLADYPANAEISNVFCWKIKDPNTMQVDFDWNKHWLSELYRSSRRAYLIVDTSVFHTGDHTRYKEYKERGHFLTNESGKPHDVDYPDGSKLGWGSIYSPKFHEDTFQYIDQLLEWVKVNDVDHRIKGYTDGAEWFLPFMTDYHPLGIVEFQKWLKEKYGNLKTLNEKWGADFDDWATVDPPRGTFLGEGAQFRTIGFDTPVVNCRWVSPEFQVIVGDEYKVTVDVKHDGVAECLCGVRVYCYDKDNKLVWGKLDGLYYWTPAPKDQWYHLDELTTFPEGTVKARLAMLLMGPGQAEFKGPSISRFPGGTNLVADESAPWDLDRDHETGEGKRREPKHFSLSLPELKRPYGNTGVAWDDWIVFSFEYMAGWLNTCAEYMKKKDPARDVLSYVGCVFGSHSLGDFAMYTQRLDISMSNSPAIDINGIQVCIADRDFTYATCPIDIVRKYSKPVMATDLIDFPYGHYSGFEAIYRGSLACVQHGLDGFFNYCWYAGFPKEYNYLHYLTKPELTTYLQHMRQAIEEVQGYTLKVDYAYILPIASYSLADPGGYKSNPLDMGGFYHLLTDCGLVTDVITPYELTKHHGDSLKSYKVVFLPDCPILPEAAHRALAEYVKNGGTIIGAGRVPMKNLAIKDPTVSLFNAEQLNTFGPFGTLTDHMDAHYVVDTIQSAQKPVEVSVDKGKVLWFNDFVGEKYWGKVKRWREAGNTPAVFMRQDYSPEALALRRYLREQCIALLDKVDSQRQIKYDVRDGSLRVARFEKEGSTKLFVLYAGKGRAMHPLLTLDDTFIGKKAKTLLDFDRTVEVSVDDKGQLKLPDFSHSCIVTFN